MAGTSTVRRLNAQPPVPERKPPPVTNDPVFFHKTNIAVGTCLRHFGRLDPNSLWEVVQIVTHIRNPNKKAKTLYLTDNVPGVLKLNDDVYLRRIGTGEERNATFGYLSYSSVWRVEDRL